jgi:hypothetical protein
MGVAAFPFRVPAVEIDATRPRFCFEIGSIHERIPLAQIVDARPVRNRWLYGWGIHRAWRGWPYRVPGRKAVEIAPTSGQRLRPGTDGPRRSGSSGSASSAFWSRVCPNAAALARKTQVPERLLSER